MNKLPFIIMTPPAFLVFCCACLAQVKTAATQINGQLEALASETLDFGFI